MKIRCLLIDDEPPALKVLQSHVFNATGLEIIGMCKNAIEASDMLSEKQIDLIFLDVKMPKLLGTDFLRNLSNRPKVIIVTAYRDFAAEGYELDVVDYLVKPVSFERFLKAVAKVKKMMGYEVVAQSDEYKRNPEAFLYFKVEKNMQKVFVNEIEYIESWKDYVKVYLNTGISIMVKQSISSIQNILSDYRFIRIHRSYLVSLEKISGYSNSAIHLGQIEIPIGRYYKLQVLNAIKMK